MRDWSKTTRVYILFDGDDESKTELSTRQVGDIISSKIITNSKSVLNMKFRTNDGWKVLCKLIEMKHPQLHKIKIITDKGKSMTIEKFIDSLDGIQII